MHKPGKMHLESSQTTPSKRGLLFFVMKRATTLLVWLSVAATASPQLGGTGGIRGRVDGLGNTSHGEAGGAVVSVVIAGEDFRPHPDNAVMDQKDLRFNPHILAVPAGTTVEFPNSDPVAHNVFSISKPKRFNLGLYQRGHTPEIRFDQAGVVALLCNVHMEMSAYVVVLDNPYFDVVDSSGRYEIRGVPSGAHLLRCWRENAPALSQQIVVRPGETVRADFPESARDSEERRQVSPRNQ